MKIAIPELSLVVLVGPSGSGKSTFAHAHFRPTEILSSDFCRGLVADDENDQSATNDAFEILHFIAAKRLDAGRLTVIDATNVQREARQPLVELARRYHCLPVAIVLDLPVNLCHERNKERTDRKFGVGVVRRQSQQLRRSMRSLKREGFTNTHILRSELQIASVEIERQPLWNNRRNEHGPFDIIGDLHGCCDELEDLLTILGYECSERPTETGTYHQLYQHPEGRKAVFLGDLVDRGPRILDTYQLVRHMVQAGNAFCVPGNHDAKALRKLQGRNVQVTHGLGQTIAELESLPKDIRADFQRDMAEFLRSLVSHYMFDEGRLVVAHAGLREEMHGRGSGRVREFTLYGETTGETDEFGLPVRHDWAAEYRGRAMVVYGHTPVVEAEWLNNTINIDTGCVFGGQLTALRYPERELVSVPAAEVYTEPIRPLDTPSDSGLTSQQEQDDVLDLVDVTGKRYISTRLRRNVTVRAENSIAALEVMSRFAVDPRWLIYLPPTMSPTETSKESGLLEHPTEALGYYRGNGVHTVVCEEKHMGSRVVVIVCRDAQVGRRRFGVMSGESGICYSRTGRRFFDDETLENQVLDQLRSALDATDFWTQFSSDWVCLDCELMPWSAKAQTLLQDQYAAVGSAGTAALDAATQLLQIASDSGAPVSELVSRYRSRSESMRRYVSAYRQYCWPVASINDLKLAPFHILATEGQVHIDKTHVWHMERIGEFASANAEDCLMATAYQQVELSDPGNASEGVQWWKTLTTQGGEGMVVKPLDFIPMGKRGLLQPAIKCRGHDYLRIIYGPEYSLPEHIERLRSRSVSRKRSLALSEFALGVEALERFVQGEPLRRVHECVFGVLALESEAVDPRL